MNLYYHYYYYNFKILFLKKVIFIIIIKMRILQIKDKSFFCAFIYMIIVQSRVIIQLIIIP